MGRKLGWRAVTDSQLDPGVKARTEGLAQRFSDVTLDAKANYLEAIGASGAFITSLLLMVPVDCRMAVCQGYLCAIADDVADSIPNEGKYDA